MKTDLGPQKINFILDEKGVVRPPAYQWQDLALRIIQELGIPNFKRSAVFKVCKENSKELIEKSLNDTKELCKTGERWKYFFKLIDQPKSDQKNTPE